MTDGEGFDVFWTGIDPQYGHSPCEIQAVYDDGVFMCNGGKSADDGAAWRYAVTAAMNGHAYAYYCVRTVTDVAREPDQWLERGLVLQHFDDVGPPVALPYYA